MRVLVIGAAGFIGTNLVRALRRRGRLRGQPIDELLLADNRPVPGEHTSLRGDIGDPAFVRTLFAREVDTVFHLAATLTLDAELDFARGLEVNVAGLLHLLAQCRAQSRPPAFLFASSISTYGGHLPETVDDDVVQTPQTSYGCHKVIAEQLLNDHSRRGFVDGRMLRLPVVLTHPGPATGSVSDRLAALIREPLNGRDAICPWTADTRVPVASVQRVTEAFLALDELPSGSFGASRAMNLPSLTVTPAEIAASVQRHGAGGRIVWQADAAMQALVDGWPRAFTSARALSLGIHGDRHVDDVVDAHAREAHGAA